MKFLTKEQQESYENAKSCCTCAEKFENKYFKDEKYCKVRELEIIFIIQGNIQVLLMAYVIQNIVYFKKFLELCIMDLTMIIILS